MTTRSILPVALSFCLLASPMAAEELTDMSAGTKVSNFVTMGKTQIPLPKGEWELKLVGTKRDQEFGKLGRVLLIQETNDSGFLYIDAISNIDSCAPYGWSKYICGRKNTHHNESRGAPNQKNAECWNVNHYSVNPNREYNKGFWKKYRNEMNDILKTVFSKRKTLLVSQFRWSNQCHFLNIDYLVNPEIFGFEPESSSWKDSAWHRELVGEDPRRKDLVAAVTDVGRELKDAVDHGFDGELDGWTSEIGLKFE